MKPIVHLASTKSLLHATMQLSLLCAFIALFIFFNSGTLKHNVYGVPSSHSLHSPLLFSQFEHTALQAPHKIITTDPQNHDTIEAPLMVPSFTHRIEEASIGIANAEAETTQIKESYDTPTPSMVAHRKGGPSYAANEANNPHSSPSALGPKISDWDRHRQSWLAENSDSMRRARRESKPSILLVTGSSPNACQNPQGDHYLLKFAKNKMDYCRLHGIEIFYSMALFDRDMGDCWSKLPLLRKLMLSHPEMEWLWWMDSDAMFTDMSFELPMEKYKEHNFVAHGWGDEVYVKKSWIGLNAGVFLIRNCQWSLDLMDAWAAMGVNQQARDKGGKVLANFITGRLPFEADDQAALIYVLNTQKEAWESKVYLENSYCLHGYWEVLVDRYEEMMESSHAGYGHDKWPFVTHFVGCKPCGSQAKERCLKQMERAFHFGDNQVLQQYGFQHMHLSTVMVEQIGNETTKNVVDPDPQQRP